MFKFIPDIIKSVGSSKKKMLTMVILLLFICGVGIFNKLIFKDDCGDLIIQNQSLVTKNYDLVGLNEKMIDNNNSIMAKYADLQKKCSEMKPETLYIMKRDTRNIANEIKENKPEEFVTVSHLERHAIIEDASFYPKEPINDELTIKLPSDSSFIVGDSTYLKTDTIAPQKRGFFRRLFSRKH